MDNLQVPHINRDTTFTVGTQVISDLQRILMNLCLSVDAQELEHKLSAGTELSEPEICVQLLITIIRGFYKQAEDTGNITYKPLDIPV